MKHLLNPALVSSPSPFRRKKRSLVPWTVFSTTQSLFIIVQRCISFATRLCESTARGGESIVGSGFTISNKIRYSIIGAWKKKTRACLCIAVRCRYFHYKCPRIEDMHPRVPLTQPTYLWFSSLCIAPLLSKPSVTSASNTRDCTNVLSPTE